jgi:Na+/proline symporter
VKPGYKTTELYVALLTIVGSTVAALAGDLSPRYAAIASAIAAAAYAIARGLAKQPPPS